MRQYLFNSYVSLVNCHFDLSQSLLLLLYLLNDPILFFEEVHLIEVHISSFLSLAEVISQYFSISHHICIIKDLVHLIREDVMLDLLIEEVPHRLFDLLQLEATLKFVFYLLAKVLLHAFPDVKSIDLLEK